MRVRVPLRSREATSGEDRSTKTVETHKFPAPVQREGIEYEFSMLFDVDMNHRVQISKARTHLFDGKLFTVTEEAGKALINWANGKEKE